MAIALVNTTSGTDQTGTNLASISATASSHTTSNLVVVFVKHGTNRTTTINVTDTALNSYIPIGPLFPGTVTGGGAAQMFYARNITGNASNVVKATFSSLVAFPTILVLQYSGLDTVAPLDAFDGRAQDTTSFVSNAFTTKFANEVVVCCVTTNNGGVTFTRGLIGGVNSTIEVHISDSAAEDLIVSSVQTGITAAMSANTGTSGIILTATFRSPISGSVDAGVVVNESLQGGAANVGVVNIITVNGS